MKEINFIACGMMGDFIHSLAVVKNICERDNAVANIYLSDAYHLYGGDRWRFPIEKVYADVCALIIRQDYINTFTILPNNIILTQSETPYINLNSWRKSIMFDHSKHGFYFRSWTTFLSDYYGYDIKSPYGWISLPDSHLMKDKIIIHRSLHRHNPSFDWEALLSDIEEEIIFLTCSQKEYDSFPFKSENIKLKLVTTISEMAVCINSCKFFIGNQSAPFALASAFDVNRFVELDKEPARFYMDENKYSDKISWYLNNDENYTNDNHKHILTCKQ